VIAATSFHWLESYTLQQFLDLMQTYSTLQSWPEVRRIGLLECIGKMIDEEFGGTVERSDLYDLSIAAAM
jgi:hypothetical protein